MTTAQILAYPAHNRNGGVLVDRVTELRRERDEAIAAAAYLQQQLEVMAVELDAERAHRPKPRPRAPWGPVVLAAIVGACAVIGLKGFGW